MTLMTWSVVININMRCIEIRNVGNYKVFGKD